MSDLEASSPIVIQTPTGQLFIEICPDCSGKCVFVATLANLSGKVITSESIKQAVPQECNSGGRIIPRDIFCTHPFRDTLIYLLATCGPNIDGSNGFAYQETDTTSCS